MRIFLLSRVFHHEQYTNEKNHNQKKTLTTPLFLIVFLLLFLICNVILSGTTTNGLYHLLKLIEYSFLGYYVATTIRDNNQIEKVFIFLAFGVLFSSLLAVFQFVNQGSLGGPFYFLGERTFSSQTPGIANASLDGLLVLRPYATFPHPNVLAGYLLFVLLPLLFLLPTIKNLSTKILFVVTLLLGTGALLLSMSRIALIIWFIVLLGVFIYHGIHAFKNKKKRISLLLVISLSIVILASGLISSPIGARLMQTSLTEESVTQREYLIEVTTTIIAEQPLLGVGLGNYLPTLAEQHAVLSPIPSLQPVHNVFLLIAAETGVIGLAIAIWLLCMTFKRLVDSFKFSPAFYTGLLISLSAYVGIGLFDHYLLTLQQGQLFLTILLGLCWSHLSSRT